MIFAHAPARLLGRLALLCSFILAAALFGFAAERTDAAPVLPEAVTLTQPDGSTFSAMPYGDEWASGYETLAGYTVIRNESSGYWSLAARDAPGRLIPGRVRADQPAPAGLAPHLRATVEVPAAALAPQRLADPQSPQAGGTHPTLVILVQFNDRPSVGSTAAQWNSSFFDATNSVKHYYQEVSYGNLTMAPATESHGASNDGVIGWLNIGYNHPNTGGNFGAANVQLARDAMVAADPYINYAAFDTNGSGYIDTNELHIVVIAAGYETSYGGTSASCSPNLWGHQFGLAGGGYYGVSAPTLDGKIIGYYGYTEFGEWHCRTGDVPGHMATIGIMVHEMGHDLDWPDLYDTDNSSYGVGQWSVMGYGSWLRTDGFAGSKPPHPDAFLKWYQGWLTPQRITGTQTGVSIGQAATNARAIQLLENPNGVDWNFQDRSGSGEYFLVENRQKVGYDAGLPGCGLLIWHIDETRVSDNRTNATDTRRLVDLEEADGLNQIDTRASFGDAGDPFPGSGAKRSFNETTNPNSKLYSGAASGVSVANISTACAATMTADFTTPGTGPTQKKLRMPFVAKPQVVVPSDGIHGVVRAQNAAVSNINVQLRACNVSECWVVASTKTDGSGIYKFQSAASLPADTAYEVVYQNGAVGGNTENGSYLTYWRSFDIPTYTAGADVNGGNFDIANVLLQSPANGSALYIPAYFSWYNRGVGGDTYAWAVADEYGDELCYVDPPQPGTSFTLTGDGGYQCGLYYDTSYRWYVYVAPNGEWTNGYGLSRYYRNVSFLHSATTAGPLLADGQGVTTVSRGSGRAAPAFADPK